MSENPVHIPNPLQRMRRRLFLVIAAWSPVLGTCAWWALAPLPAAAVLDASDRGGIGDKPPNVGSLSGPGRIDASVFAVALWNPAPPPAQPAAAQSDAPSPPPPLNIQLIGVITDMVDGRPVQKAAIYDADSDRLMIIANGEKLREHTVRVLPNGLVELVDGQMTRQYRLRPDEPPLPARGST